MIRVLVVDDSVVIRKLITDQLGREPDIRVVGTAADPYEARERIAELAPDVVTLDVELPRMNGLDFLKKLMRHHPLPVVVISALVLPGSEVAARALALGAKAVLPKSVLNLGPSGGDQELIRAIRASFSTGATRWRSRRSEGVIALGASTGGPTAIEYLLSRLSPDLPGMVVVQHMPPGFTAPFAQRLASVCDLDVREAAEGDRVASGSVLIAPAGVHCRVSRTTAGWFVRLSEGPRVHHQRPAVDVLFESVAQQAGNLGIGVLLTGMGRDGAEGLRAMRGAGALTIAEAEETCIVYGMPKAAVDMGAAASVVPLHGIPQLLRRATA